MLDLKLLNFLKDAYKNAKHSVSECISYNAFFTVKTFLNTKGTVFLVLPNLHQAQLYFDYLSNIFDTEQVLFFPVDELITQIMAFSSKDFLSQRVNTIHALLKDQRKIVVTNDLALTKRLFSVNKYRENLVFIKPGMELKPETLAEKLITFGYQKEYTLSAPDTYSIRGDIFDIYPLGYTDPIRINFSDDLVETIKTFSLDTQLSKTNVESLSLFPATELFYTDDELKQAESKIKAYFNNLNLSMEEKEKLNKDMLNLVNRTELGSLGLYLGFFPESNNTIFDFDNTSEVIFVDKEKYLINNTQRQDDLAQFKTSYNGSNLITNNFLYDFEKSLSRATLEFQTNVFLSEKYVFEPDFYAGNFEKFYIYNKDIIKNYQTVLLYKTDAEKNQIIDFLLEKEIKFSNSLDNKEVNVWLVKDDTHLSFIDPFLKLAVFSAYVLFNSNSKPKVRYKALLGSAKTLENPDELTINEYVVHVNFGIGKYLGLSTNTISGFKKDYLLLEYANSEKVYVPVSQINLVLKYAKPGTDVKLSVLGSKKWTASKLKAFENAKAVASRLIALYEARYNSQGAEIKGEPELEQELANDFNFQLTKDQETAIQAVYTDMAKPVPMERLIIGDVGFGKTEVALRAAYRAIISGKQVAYICPTTILASQQSELFKSRLTKFGVNVAVLSRLVEKIKQNKYIQGLSTGIYDIAIGTHRLLSKDIKFKNLGLLIIDEEQRFGAIDKEKIKELTLNVDTLYLSATPIPRTLEQTLSGLKSYSLIETPPNNRYPVQTYVLPHEDLIVKEIIQRELSRAGQVFYLFNDTVKIKQKLETLKSQVPEAKIAYVHSRLNKAEIENILSNFVEHKIDVLLTTTIIEAGIDIANANTLIVERADHFGLAQLYQLRGRVGRSDKIAYAYFTYQKDKEMTEDAKKRLNAIKRFVNLGSGFSISLEDLSIRGSGDIFGKEQSGFIESVGTQMYLKLISEQLTGKPAFEETDTKTSFYSQSIDKTYIESENLRIAYHKKIARLTSFKEAESLLAEFKDIFGVVPGSEQNYVYSVVLKNLRQRLGILNISLANKEVGIEFKVNPNAIMSKKPVLAFCVKNQNIRLKSTFNSTIVYLKTDNLAEWTKETILFLEHLEKEAENADN